jgi:predicted phosphodiesterase
MVPARGNRQRPHPDDYSLPVDLADFAALSLVLGRITDRAVTVSAVAAQPMEAFCEIGTASGQYTRQMGVRNLAASSPVEILLDNLAPNTAYFYRLQTRQPGEAAFHPQPECTFHTQRLAGSTFTFALQGDSHPERSQMSDPALYVRTLQTAAAAQPDFYFCLGDDFSVDTLRALTADTVTGRYTLQRPFLGLVARSAPLFLVNGNHEQASLFNYHQTGTPHDIAVWAQTARNRFFPLPAPDTFYTGNAESLPDIGPLRDDYAFTWGDALFVILDNYWHSPAQVDNPVGGGDNNGAKNRDWWDITLGDAQYQWLKKTLAESKAKFKFVFAHHVMGSGRGGTDECDLWEWGGRNRRGIWEFTQKRPGWEFPIHQLMAKYNVTIFFHGHDHLFAKQERDGVVYQELPLPADQRYMTYNDDRYATGTKRPNSGFLKVTVSPEQVQVDYVRCYLPKDETAQHKTGEIAHSYVIKAKVSHE